MTVKPIIGVAGLGTMGLGIAQIYTQAGFAVIATDENAVARGSAAARLRDALDKRVAAGKLDEQSRDETLGRLTIAGGLEAMGKASLVAEAIVETLEAKRNLFRMLEVIVESDCVLATNTSSLPVAAISRGMHNPARFLGLHFFNPAPAMKLVELIAHDGTDAGSLALARAVTEAAGKTVIACADRPGFIVNRCARPFYGEALALLEEGRTASDIDAAILADGYRIGPFALIDLIGADINLAATQGLSISMNHHPRYHVFDALKSQVASGNVGRKSGCGFLFPDPPGSAPADAASIALRIEATLVNEAASLLGEGGSSQEAIDTAMRLGLNFPRGPFETARRLGVAKVKATLSALEAAAPPHLKGRYVISPALEAMT